MIEFSEVKHADSVTVTIYMAGNFEVASQVCREWCMDVGACVTVNKTTYIYTGGEEHGVTIGFINYPRFPSDLKTITDNAFELAQLLMVRLCQSSFSIANQNTTTWYSRRS